jgi:hypothetical protein
VTYSVISCLGADTSEAKLIVVSDIWVTGVNMEMVYTCVVVGLAFPAVSTPMNFSVVVEGIGMGLLYTLLDVVGSEPLVV